MPILALLLLALVICFPRGALSEAPPEGRNQVTQVVLPEKETSPDADSPEDPGDSGEASAVRSGGTHMGHDPEGLESVYPDIPRLNLRGFLDLSFILEEEQNKKNDTFSIGQFDLLITSRISDRVSFLAETYFSNPQTGPSSFILTRAIIQYSLSSPFNLRFGSVHANLGYWNHAYHHGSYHQVTVSRPEIYRYDRAYLPIHSFGMEIFGVFELPHIDIEHNIGVYNGRGRTPGALPRVEDLNSQKAVSLLVTALPHAVEGLRIGASLYLDKIPPDPDPGTPNRTLSIDERILGAYWVYRNQGIELLGEVFDIYHDDQSTAKTYDTLGMYVQVGWEIGGFTPYYRFDRINFGDNDPLYFSYFSPLLVDDLSGHTLGVRWDFIPWNAFKVEYSYADNENNPDGQSLTANLSFAF
jgi:hypothetical protein